MLHDGNTFSVFRFGESRGNLNRRSTCSPTASQAIPSFSQHHARFSSDLKLLLSQELQGTPKAFRTPFRFPEKDMGQSKGALSLWHHLRQYSKPTGDEGMLRTALSESRRFSCDRAFYRLRTNPSNTQHCGLHPSLAVDTVLRYFGRSPASTCLPARCRSHYRPTT